MARLGDVCIINPKTPVIDDNLTVSFIPMPKVGENGEFDASEIKEYREVKKGFTYFQNGDVLFAKITPCMENGKGAVARKLENGIGFGSTEFHILRPKDGNVLSKWIYYLLSWSNFRKEAENNMTGSAGQKRVPKSFLENYNVMLPHLEKQKNQIDSLAKIDDVITLRKQQLSKLDELVKSRFIELFGNVRDNEKNWEKVSLKSVAEVRGRVGWKGYKKDDLRESGPFVLGATHLTESGCIDLSSPVYLSREKYEESPEIMLQKNDLIFTQRGNTIGKVGLLENDIGEATINPCVLILRPLTINPIYFKTYFILDETKSDMWSLNAGSAQPMITQKGIGEYMLMLPPLELQEQFATFVKQTDKSKFEIQKSLEKLETLKKALMQKYFG